MKNLFASLVATASLAVLASAHGAGILLTYAEAPGIQNSTLSNTSVINFDSIAPNLDGSLTWSGAGTYDKVAIIPADKYGGAGGTGKYLVQSTSIPTGGAVSTTTLNLDTPISYFGLWWSAGDPKNRLAFYNGTTLVADFTTATLLSVLPPSYMGNPNAPFLGQNSGEHYAFFNIYGQSGTTFDKIVFGNDGTSGFESDNHTIRVGAWGTETGEDGPEPGVPVMTVDGTTVVAVPETGTWVMGMLAIAVAAFLMRRRVKHAGQSAA